MMQRLLLTTLLAVSVSLVGLPTTTDAQSVYPKRTTVWKIGQAHWGRTFFGGPDGTARLVTMGGRVVNEWGTLDDQIGFVKPIQDNTGHVLAMSGVINIRNYPRPRSDKLIQFDNNGNRFFVWETPPLSKGEFGGFHHDMERLDNGNTYVLCSTLITIPSISPVELIDDCIVELDFNGDVVWEWYTHDHFDSFGFTDEQKDLIAQAGGDWAHANALSIIPDNDHTDPAFTPGNIMISYRQINTVVIIDRDTGEIVWTLGPNDAPQIGQHNAYMIDGQLEGAGNIMLFDNGLQAGYPPISRAFSRVLEINPVTKAIVWQYNAAFSGLPIWSMFSPIISGAERLPNGNTMITEGTKGRLFEVTSTGEIVWEYMSPFFDTSGGPGGVEVKDYGIFRAYRMPWWWGAPDPAPQ